MTSGSFSTVDLDSTEALAIFLTREDYASGCIDHDELQRRLGAIVGVDGEQERARVLHTDDVVDVTYFGSPRSIGLAASWRWPDD